MKLIAITCTALACVALGACSEREQVSGTRKSDTPPSSTAAGPFTASGWKSGDKTSWETQIAARARLQNEYNRTGSH